MSLNWFRLQSGKRGVAQNMAVDAALLARSAMLGQPVLRFYQWSEPGATFGYSQRYSEVAAMTDLQPLIRRPTGGGVVKHVNDWTYSLVIPPSDPWFDLKAAESYQRIHEWMAKVFSELGVPAELAPEQNPEGAGQCFIGAERSDLLVRGEKIAGAAQRRTRDGLLIQGSIQPRPAGLGREHWEDTVCAVAQAQWGVSWQRLDMVPVLASELEDLVSRQFGNDTFNRKR